MKFSLYLAIFGLCGFKFVPGIALMFASGLGLSLPERMLLSGSGFMAGVFLYTFAGERIKQIWRRLFVKKPKPMKDMEPQPKNKRIQQIWDRYGLAGVAFITPPIISPPIGVAIALAFGVPRWKLIGYMGASILFWSFIFSYFGEYILHFINHSVKPLFV